LHQKLTGADEELHIFLIEMGEPEVQSECHLGPLGRLQRQFGKIRMVRRMKERSDLEL
jgi:hypothetical protein